MWFLTVFCCVYLAASCIIGGLSLKMISANPEEFDAYRSNDPMVRLENVASVMLFGPIYLILALVTPRD